MIAQGVRIGGDGQAANRRIHSLANLLREQDRQDSAQRRLRLALGDETRRAEQDEPVSAARWQELSAQLDSFASLTAAAQPDDVPPEITGTLAQARLAAMNFVGAGHGLIDTAQHDRARIQDRMPAFVAALKDLEAARTRTRELLNRTIGQAVDDNVVFADESVSKFILGAVLACLLLLLVALWLHIRVIAPIVAIAGRLRNFDPATIACADVPCLDRQDELGDLARGLFEYQKAVEDRQAAQRRIDYLAYHDVLTGLPNRLQFERRLQAELAGGQSEDWQAAVFAIDLDEFKEINDLHGHPGGDVALKHVGALLQQCAGADDLVARVGGDEFAIIQAPAPQPQGARALLAHLASAMAEGERAAIPFKVSIGVAVAAPGQTPDDVYKAADVALYRAKSDGRNRARFYDAGLQEEVRLGRVLARDLEHAAANGELFVAYQPIATVAKQIVGYEALLRWHHPTLGMISPTQFIPVAEASGAINQIGLWMADQALAAAARWSPELTLSLNLSPIQFREAGLGIDLLKLAERHGMPGSRLNFEVTESATLLGKNRNMVLDVLRHLQGAGAAIAMDDFGTGHSSLSDLRDFGFDMLKIDRTFVASMLEDRSSALIVQAIIGLGHSLGKAIVAEGVETEAQLSRLREWNCDRIQGYLIGRPMPDTVTVPARVASC
ncbi:putative bifunctional diguanylate cyclase/phosphodiesterase [Croceibacterium mercuriale]|uniref:putative bifunctional diguanylate cyclase/phosphodiesterase n=1 Tax=Croceibacterium mercuriale TaxID=1572751 RepID=UPI0006922BBE|nr:bifunctional diguanylate cyclase/phosphodiesterase [Croceibacterium mercuriale]